MAQTERSNTDIIALLADNAAGAISPQDLRDAIASFMGYASMVLSVGGAPQVMNAVGTTPVLVDVFDVALTQSADVNVGGTAVTLSPDYRLTVNSTGVYSVHFFASFSSSANNKLVTFTPHVNGVASSLLEVDRFIATGSDTGVVAMQSIVPYTAGQYGDIRVNVDSGTANLTFLAAGMSIHRVG